MIDTDKIEQEVNWFMGDKDNQQHLVKYVPDLLAEVKRLREGIKDYLALPMPSRDELRELIE